MAPSATIECNERFRPDRYNIRILATPCDGYVECTKQEDNNCGEELEQSIYYIVLGFLLIVSMVWFFLYKIYRKEMSDKKVEIELDDMNLSCIERQEWVPRLCKTMIGDNLAELKVYNLVQIV